MKKTIFILLILATNTISLMAQGGASRLTVEERIRNMHEKIDSAFQTDEPTLARVDSVLEAYYRGTDTLFHKLMDGPRPDRETMQQKMQPFVDERDKQLKTLFGDEDFEKWKTEIEPAMRRRGKQSQQ